MLGLEDGIVRLVSWSPDLPRLFQEEAERLGRALDIPAGRIEHIGSTAVEGLKAKPILDLMAPVDSLESGRARIPALVALGYEFRDRDDIPDRLYFVLRSADRRHTHHLSLTEAGSGYWRNQLLFRDHLRGRAEAREAYSQLKEELAAKRRHDRRAYVEGKTGFIHAALREAAG